MERLDEIAGEGAQLVLRPGEAGTRQEPRLSVQDHRLLQLHDFRRDLEEQVVTPGGGQVSIDVLAKEVIARHAAKGCEDRGGIPRASPERRVRDRLTIDRKSTRLNSS